MEYIDILTPDGLLTGKSKSKKQIHIDGDWHRAAHIWILNSNSELLIQRRSKTKINYPDVWDTSVAGHISAGENSQDTAIREIEEEIGISIDESELLYLGETTQQKISQNGRYIDNEFVDTFLVKKDIKLSKMIKQDSEVDELKYISIDKLQSWVDEKNPELLEHDQEFELLFSYLKNHH